MSNPLTGNKAPRPETSKSPDGISTSRTVTAPIAVSRWVRNGKHPNATFQSMFGEAANQAGMFRCKEVFRWGMRTNPALSAGTGDRPRWRFACHTGPYTCYFRVIAVLCPADTGLDTDAYVRVDCVTGGVTTSETFHYGATPFNGGTTGFESFKVVDKFIQVTADADYTVTINDVDNARIQSINVHEYASLTQNFNGYLPQNFAAQGPILDAYRQNLSEVTRNLWRRGGAQVWNWTNDDDAIPFSTASATPINLIDGVSTTNNANSIGATLDMTGKARLSQTTGVPVKMYVFGENNTAADGRLYLKDSTGATIMSITSGWNVAGGYTWMSTTGVLPATVGKYDLLAAAASGTTNVLAVSIFEYDA